MAWSIYDSRVLFNAKAIRPIATEYGVKRVRQILFQNGIMPQKLAFL